MPLNVTNNIVTYVTKEHLKILRTPINQWEVNISMGNKHMICKNKSQKKKCKWLINGTHVQTH